MSDGIIQGSEADFGKEQLPDWRPCALLALADNAAPVARQLRRLGWDVYLAESGPQLRRLVRLLDVDLVILDGRLTGEGGWLTCAKLREEWPVGQIVVLAEAGPRDARLGAFVGANAVVPWHEALPVASPLPMRLAA